MANTCNQTLSNIARDCGSGKGGIQTTVYVALREDVDFDNITYGESAEPYNTIATLPLVSGKKWVKYEFPKNASSFTSTYQYDGTTGEATFAQNALTLAFRKMDASKRLSLEALLLSDVVVVFTDANGENYFMGMEEPVTSTSAEFATGAARTDANSITIVLGDTTASFPLMPTATCMDTIKQNVQA